MLATLLEALKAWDDEAATKEAFVRANTPDDDGDPICGYREWDEAIEDYNYRLAERGVALASALRAALTTPTAQATQKASA